MSNTTDRPTSDTIVAGMKELLAEEKKDSVTIRVSGSHLYALSIQKLINEGEAICNALKEEASNSFDPTYTDFATRLEKALAMAAWVRDDLRNYHP
jgi:hypothetical protein